MAGREPEGEQAPADGALPPASAAELGAAAAEFGVYLHVPFCASRCGYCDFNTYTPGELGSAAGPERFVDAALAEIAFAGRVLDGRAPPASTVFVGGGTPTLLPPEQLGRLLAAVRDTIGLAPDVEVTTEANPESVGPVELDALRAAGFTRISLGMQSAAEHVLAVLDRQHTPGRAAAAAAQARVAGFEHVNLDLIYGAPGETDEDWAESLAAALDAGPDHVSAYALIVEDGTRLARQVAGGEVSAPDDDVLADRYLAADDALRAAGMSWYEVSNWATGDASRSRHNRLYWTGAHWWGIGPGAHSHVGGTRWWNVRHPARYAERLENGLSPAAAREVLDADTRRVERVLLELRLVEGLDVSVLDPTGLVTAQDAAQRGLLDAAALAAGRAVLSRSGRLLADAVVRDLLG